MSVLSRARCGDPVRCATLGRRARTEMGRGEEEGRHAGPWSQWRTGLREDEQRRGAESSHQHTIGQCQQLSWCCRGSSSVTSRPCLCLSSPLATCHSSTSSLHTTLTLFRAQLHKDPTPVRRGSEQAVPNPEIDWVYKLSVTNSSIMAVVTSRQTVCSVP